jgi:methylphosphotriester-DNA--protein-cysteine methyltransferase
MRINLTHCMHKGHVWLIFLTRLNAREENMTAMAMDLGFSTPGNFSRFFRDHRGVTPTTYRRVCHASVEMA